MFFLSNKKYKVSIKGRSEILYSENKKKAIIDIEMLIGEKDIVIYFENFYSWEPPFDTEVISKEDKLRIKGNIAVELESKGVKIDWG